MHLVLGAIAMRSWWRESGATVAGATDDSHKTAHGATSSQPSTVSLGGNRLPSTVRDGRSSRLLVVLPWSDLTVLGFGLF